MLIELEYIDRVREYLNAMEFDVVVPMNKLCKEEGREKFRHALMYIIDGREMYDAGYDLAINEDWSTIRKYKIR